MSLFDKIRRHAAVATGNFESMFKATADIPPLPAAAAQLIAEINRPEPAIGRLETILSSSPELSAKVLKTVNSAFFALRSRVTSTRHALAVLGLRKIREIALAYTMLEALPKPRVEVFDHEALWIDSLIMAMLAKSFTKRFLPGKEEETFASALLSDIAIIVLSSSWGEYYSPILNEWKSRPKRLSEIEREQFGWDHGQAGAWIVKSWNFSEEMVCYIGAHNLTFESIKNHELDNTIALPIALTSVASSVLKPDLEHPSFLINTAIAALKITPSEFIKAVEEVKANFHEIRTLFGLPERNADQVLDNLIQAAEDKGESSC